MPSYMWTAGFTVGSHLTVTARTMTAEEAATGGRSTPQPYMLYVMLACWVSQPARGLFAWLRRPIFSCLTHQSLDFSGSSINIFL